MLPFATFTVSACLSFLTINRKVQSSNLQIIPVEKVVNLKKETESMIIKDEG